MWFAQNAPRQARQCRRRRDPTICISSAWWRSAICGPAWRKPPQQKLAAGGDGGRSHEGQAGDRPLLHGAPACRRPARIWPASRRGAAEHDGIAGGGVLESRHGRFLASAGRARRHRRARRRRRPYGAAGRERYGCRVLATPGDDQPDGGRRARRPSRPCCRRGHQSLGIKARRQPPMPPRRSACASSPTRAASPASRAGGLRLRGSRRATKRRRSVGGNPRARGGQCRAFSTSGCRRSWGAVKT